MYQEISDQIEVMGVYSTHGFVPKKFKWRAHTYTIDEVTFISEVRDGGVKQRLYSVLSGANLYRLHFNRESERWILQEVWCE